MRVAGGRTIVWGRQSYRLSEQDLKAESFDGYGEDWPIGYPDLVPYYDLVEEYVGISGSGGRRAGAAGQPVPPRDADDLRRDAGAERVEEKLAGR